jgi:hypothetical protein
VVNDGIKIVVPMFIVGGGLMEIEAELNGGENDTPRLFESVSQVQS